MYILVRARRLTVHLGFADHFDVHRRHQRTPLGTELIFRAHKAGLRGATTLHGVEGFGHSDKIHHTPTWGLVDRAPSIVIIIDTADRIDAFIQANEELFGQCLATISDLQVLRDAPDDQPNAVMSR